MSAHRRTKIRNEKRITAKRRKNELKRMLVVEIILLLTQPIAWGLAYWFGQLEMSSGALAIWMLAGMLVQLLFVFHTIWEIKSKKALSRWSSPIFLIYWTSTAGMYIAFGCELKNAFLGTLPCLYVAGLFVMAAVGTWIDLVVFFLMYAFSVVRMNLAHTLRLEDNVYITIIVLLCGLAFHYRNRAGAQLERDAKDLRAVTTMAETDPMTRLLNRRGMGSKMVSIWPMCVRDEKSVAVIMLDIDYFKSYNDAFGHLQGDVCIKEVANQISICTRRETDFAARVGGEEFLVFLNGVGPKQALTWAKDLKDCIEGLRIPHTSSNFLPFVTVSVGISVRQVNRNVDFFELQDQADKALYEAKGSGRACICMNGHIYAQTLRNPQEQVNIEQTQPIGFRPLS